MNKSCLILLSVLLSVSVSVAQTTLLPNRNMPRHGDILPIRSLDKLFVDAIGQEPVWNLSDVDMNDEELYTEYFHENDSGLALTRMCDDRLIHYDLQTDSLLLTGYESNQERVIFNSPLLLLHFPVCYGDSAESDFRAEGVYCEKIGYCINGHYKVKADAYGTIILPDGDTLLHVLRTHAVITTDDASGHIYHWYARGYRYPVLESIRYCYPHGIQSQKNIYCPISGQACLDDEENKLARLTIDWQKEALEQKAEQGKHSYTQKRLTKEHWLMIKKREEDSGRASTGNWSQGGIPMSIPYQEIE